MSKIECPVRTDNCRAYVGLINHEMDISTSHIYAQKDVGMKFFQIYALSFSGFITLSSYFYKIVFDAHSKVNNSLLTPFSWICVVSAISLFIYGLGMVRYFGHLYVSLTSSYKHLIGMRNLKGACFPCEHFYGLGNHIKRPDDIVTHYGLVFLAYLLFGIVNFMILSMPYFFWAYSGSQESSDCLVWTAFILFCGMYLYQYFWFVFSKEKIISHALEGDETYKNIRTKINEIDKEEKGRHLGGFLTSEIVFMLAYTIFLIYAGFFDIYSVRYGVDENLAIFLLFFPLFFASCHKVSDYYKQINKYREKIEPSVKK